MLERLAEPSFWQEFLDYKQEHALLDRFELAALTSFICERRFEAPTRGLSNGSFYFSPPERREISKLGAAKKRVVYTFPEDENFLLKGLAYLLYRYDGALAPNCYAFRRDVGAKRAFTDLARANGTGKLWCFKSDISDYFNSIDVELLSDILRGVVTDDAPLLALLLELLGEGRSVWRGEVISERRGAMAGTPISPFLANVYLKEMDFWFYERGVRYARYSDDVIIFDTEEKLEEHIAAYRGFLEKYRLRVNPAKETISAPGEPWSFLGFEAREGGVDISRATVRKLMGKIKRSARSLRRWILKKEADPERALRAFNRKFNLKFYSAGAGRELCWARWFFPIITTDKSLHAIDEYMQQCERYIVTGKHNKASRAAAPYDMLKACGYRPLVAAYYARGDDAPTAAGSN